MDLTNDAAGGKSTTTEFAPFLNFTLFVGKPSEEVKHIGGNNGGDSYWVYSCDAHNGTGQFVVIQVWGEEVAKQMRDWFV